MKDGNPKLCSYILYNVKYRHTKELCGSSMMFMLLIHLIMIFLNRNMS
jgi:hypothetical protein